MRTPLETVHKLTQLFQLVWISSGFGLFKFLVLSVCLLLLHGSKPWIIEEAQISIFHILIILWIGRAKALVTQK